MKKLAKEKLPELWSQLAAQGRLFLPVEEDGVVRFAPWREGAAVNLESLNSVVPPKHLFFPQTDPYFRFQVNRGLKIVPIEEDDKEQVLFAVRPCDVRSFELLDKVFMDDPVDSLYNKRREKTTVVALGCKEPDQTCFCTAFGLEPGAAPGADLLLTDVGDGFVVEGQSKKGERLLDRIGGLMSEASPEDVNKANNQKSKAASSQKHGLSVEGICEALDGKFEDPVWEKFYHRCLGCGICTYLCPTCHCFDVQDFSRGFEGHRFRCWDSCMFGDFTLMASGENPRPTQKERVRNRFLHKLNYFPRNFGDYACVGCGRCVRKCPVNLDIMQVIKEIGGVASGSC